MTLSVFDLFSIGIGPSSSHTVGPMRAALMFVYELQKNSTYADTSRICITLHGSLGSTGKGHGSDKAVLLGLMGETPERTNPRETLSIVRRINQSKRLTLAGGRTIDLLPERDIVFDGLHELPLHSNGITFLAQDARGMSLCVRHYYSVGGGFVVPGDDTATDTSADTCSSALKSAKNSETASLITSASAVTADSPTASVPYSFTTGVELLDICRKTGYSIAKVMMENELVFRTETHINSSLDEIWNVMNECIDAGCRTEGMLPGSLRVLRRAPRLYHKLSVEGRTPDPLGGMDWITLYAMAVNEENAAGGRVVTAPTNGAAGVIPAVLRYYTQFINGADAAGIRRFLLTAAAICIIVKTNASISGAEVGCQGEVGVACSMAAAGLTAVLGGSAKQVENAAEIGMEHNLGLTCDPVGGYVQVPCIERNAIAAIKAVAAARTALRGDGTHIVSLDDVVKTMRDTGRDMQSKYKETSLGGLAVNVTEC